MINDDLFYLINNGLSNPFLDVVMPIISDLGSFEFLAIFCVVIIVISSKRLLNRQDIKKFAILAFASLLLSGLIVFVIKIAIQEPRPYLLLSHVKLLSATTDPNAFPSGHTSSICSIVFLIVFESKKRLSGRNLALIIFAFIIGFSRIYIGLHFPFDVLVGAVIGIIGAFIVYKLDKSKKFNKIIENV